MGEADNPYRPQGIDNLFVAGMLADVSRAEAEQLTFLGNSVALGRRIGQAAAKIVGNPDLGVPAGGQWPSNGGVGVDPAYSASSTIREAIKRPLHVGSSTSTYTTSTSSLPILAEADVAAAAGAETMFLSPTEFAMQGSAASPHQLGRNYYNTDVGFLNSPDAGDLFTFALRARLGIPADKNWNLSHRVYVLTCPSRFDKLTEL